MIRTKSIYESKEKLDGLHVLITRFYPWGVKKNHFDIWKKELAPSKQLLKEYKTKNKSNNITLLCYEKEGKSCHRHLLKKIIENQSKRKI